MSTGSNRAMHLLNTLIVALSLLTIATAMVLIVALVSVGGVLRCPLLGYVVGAVGQRMRSAVDHSPWLTPGDSWADDRRTSRLAWSDTIMSWPEATSASVNFRRPCGM